MTTVRHRANRLGLTVSERTALYRTEQAWGHVLGVGIALILSAALFVVLGGVR